MKYGRQRLKDIVEKEGREEGAKDQQQENINLTPHEQERALKEAYRSFMVSGTPKTKTLMENQLNEMESAKIIRTLWVR